MKLRVCFAAIVAAACASACAKSDPSKLISPTTVVAGVNGAFAQNPVPFNGRGSCSASFPNSWVLRPELRETNGVDLTLKSWTYVIKDRTGNVLDSFDASDEIARFFGSATLPAHGTLSSSFLDCEAQNFPTGSVEFTFAGLDAGGFPVSFTMSATLAQ
jgi:hypothetical protein